MCITYYASCWLHTCLPLLLSLLLSHCRVCSVMPHSYVLFFQLREEDYRRTVGELKGGVTLVKHTVGACFRMKSVRKSIGTRFSSGSRDRQRSSV